MTTSLLPKGLYDLLGDEATTKNNIINVLTSTYADYSYNRIDPPIVDYTENIFANQSNILEEQSFRFVDIFSQKTLAVRPDITIQLSRIVNSRFSGKDLPIRLYYAGEVLRAKGSKLDEDRQLTQVGLELIGKNDEKAIIEVVRIAVDSLEKLGLKDLYVDFNLPGLASLIIKDLKLDKNDLQELLDAIRRKDEKIILQLAGEKTDILVTLIDPTLDLKKLKSIKLPKEISSVISKLEEIITSLQKIIPGVAISVDPLDLSQFEYHSDIGFSIFSKSVLGELGRGGSYKIANPDQSIDAVGFTIYINKLFKILEKVDEKPQEKVSIDIPPKEIDSFIKKGKRVVFDK